MTDGEVSNTDEVHDIVEEHRHWCEVHSFGLGTGVCRDLVEGLAICTGGIFCFIGDGMNLNVKVIDALTRAVEPSYT